MNRASVSIRYFCLALLLVIGLMPYLYEDSIVAAVHGNQSMHFGGEQKESGDAGDVKLYDLDLLDQNGRKVKFVSDVLEDKIAVVNFIFTNCPTACPILVQIFVLLQDELGDRLGKDVALISISVDPTRDIPPRLKKFAQKHNASSEWTFLTGKKRNIDQVLTGLDSYSADIWEHATKVMVGDARTGKWINLYGFPGPDEIQEKIEEIISYRDNHGLNSNEK